MACILCAGIAAVFVGLRLYTRFWISRHPGWDDGMVVVALVFSIILCPIYRMRKAPHCKHESQVLTSLQSWSTA